MLIRLKGNCDKIDDYAYKVNVNIPVYYLPNNNYSIALRMICLNVQYDDTIDESIDISPFYKLCTNLVDKSCFNPEQEIYSFYATHFSLPKSKDNCYAYAAPDLLREYKIQLTALHNAEFTLTTLQPHADLEIIYIEILLEISSHAGL